MNSFVLFIIRTFSLFTEVQDKPALDKIVIGQSVELSGEATGKEKRCAPYAATCSADKRVSVSFSVRHFADPPAFMNSVNGVCRTAKPRECSSLTKVAEA